jgi:HD-GYP domain-containing protein (c-di-GMP phosphodiesterase class II)
VAHAVAAVRERIKLGLEKRADLFGPQKRGRTGEGHLAVRCKQAQTGVEITAIVGVIHALGNRAWFSHQWAPENRGWPLSFSDRSVSVPAARAPGIGRFTHNSPAAMTRLAEVLGVLCLATDLGTGKPLDHGLRTCLLAMDIGHDLELGEAALLNLYYLAMLRMLGCTVDAFIAADIMGDEVAVGGAMETLDLEDHLQMVAWMLTRFARQEPPMRRARLLSRMLSFSGARSGMMAGHCEVAQMLAQRLGFSDGVRQDLGYVYERWDGRGAPNGTRGEQIPLSMRILPLARDVEIFLRVGGVDAARSVVRERSGGSYDPQLAERVGQRLPALAQRLEVPSVWDAMLDAEPGSRPVLGAAALETALKVVADFVDVKSPFTLGHSAAVADLARGAAAQCGLDSDNQTFVAHAGLVHDLGRVGVTSAIWVAARPLTEDEWERVRLHPYYSERVLSRSTALAKVARLAGSHHERSDGSGYHRGIDAAGLPLPARLLAAADTYRALTEVRAYRPAWSVAQAAATLRGEARAGRLNGEAVEAVLAAAGHTPTRRMWPAGLSDREVEVLRLLARGQPNKAIARTLSVTPKTVEHHVQHIYDKLGVATRAGATLFAAQHDLVHRDPV